MEHISLISTLIPPSNQRLGDASVIFGHVSPPKHLPYPLKLLQLRGLLISPSRIMRLECWGVPNVSTDHAVTIIRVNDIEQVGKSYKHLSLGSVGGKAVIVWPEERATNQYGATTRYTERGAKIYLEFWLTGKRIDEKYLNGHVVNEKRRWNVLLR
jgi:hypothetical protein